MIPEQFRGRLRLPVVAAPMFLVSGPELVAAACRVGVVGTFPALNQRTTEGFEDWVVRVSSAVEAARTSHPDRPVAPYGVNLIVHRSNPRVQADLEVCARRRVPLVITSLGAVPELVDTVHGYGGLVFHDVVNVRHARKAAAAGVDGLVLVCAGAGGHAGTTSPFALLPEVRSFFPGTILLAGAISDGRSVAAARALGADLAYVGTRFIATEESAADPAYKRMILDSAAADVAYTAAVSGVPGSFLKGSLRNAGLDPEDLPAAKPDLSLSSEEERKAWRDIWSAGQGVGQIADLPDVATLVDRMAAEYRAAAAGLAADPFAAA